MTIPPPTPEAIEALARELRAVRLCRVCGTEVTLTPYLLKSGKRLCRSCQTVISADWYRSHPEAKRAKERRYRDAHRDSRRAEYVRYREKNADKVKARLAVSSALKSGALSREDCRVCGERRSEAHHDDYSKPLDVTWLCNVHHRERHGDLFAPQVAR